MRVEVTPTQLNIDPVLGGSCTLVRVLRIVEQGRFGNLPFVRSKEQDVSTRRVHFVRLPWVDRLLLYVLNLQRIELLIENLTQIHDDALVDLLPKVSAENLNERYFERGNLAVHEDASQVKLYLKANIYVRPIDCRRPPQGETAVGDLIETGSLCVCQFLVLHAFLKAAVVYYNKIIAQESLVPIDKEAVVALWYCLLGDRKNAVRNPMTLVSMRSVLSRLERGDTVNVA
mmetsp:Transcript_21406/g.67161  ORF Transcript_21406/g.67161 Transcript_21406/m.67161 type:complete len:230 (-) Transcript_21406:2358-3047(-)